MCRRACKVLTVETSSYHYKSRRTDPALLKKRVKEICETHGHGQREQAGRERRLGIGVIQNTRPQAIDGTVITVPRQEIAQVLNMIGRDLTAARRGRTTLGLGIEGLGLQEIGIH